jgi:hypothetical protein
LHGISSFKEVADYVSNLHYGGESGFLNINSVVCILPFDKLKEFLVSAVWGELLHIVRTEIFYQLSGEPMSKLGDDFVVEKLPEEANASFQLQKNFVVKILNKDAPLTIALNEGVFYSLIFTKEELYTILGKDLCISLDMFLSLGDSEAVAETYYAVMKSEPHVGGQENKTLDMQMLVEWSLPSVI